MKKLVFVDLDETLIHTLSVFFEDPPAKDSKKVKIGEHNYDVVLRQGALYFLEILRNSGEVYMLTAATEDYAFAMNKAFKLGFKEEQIYSREDISSSIASSKHFGKGKVYLFDNLPRFENGTKIRFLRPLGELTYIQVTPEFYSNKTAAFTHEQIELLVSNIS